MQPAVELKLDACDRVAKLLTGRSIPIDQEETSLEGIPEEFVGNFYLVLVAICHQTSPRGQPPLEGQIDGIHRRGWDFLSSKLEEASRRDPGWLLPERWSTLSANELTSLFNDPEYGNRLTSPPLRAELLRDLGSRMLAQKWINANQIYELCGARIATGKPNLLGSLSMFRAYSDPVRKKSLFYLALMRNANLWSYVDNEQLGPPVDYHEVRGHLRIGTVVINDATLLGKIRAGQAVEQDEDVAIRQAVFDSIMYISKKSGLNNPSQLHYLFWNLFRSVCTREEPKCLYVHPDNQLPQRYKRLLGEAVGQKCLFSSVCLSADKPYPLVEHQCETDYY